MPTKSKPKTISAKKRPAKSKSATEIVEVKKRPTKAERDAAIESARNADILNLMVEIWERLKKFNFVPVAYAEEHENATDLERGFKMILDQIWTASEIGIDVRVAFEINYKSISRQAEDLAERWYKGEDLEPELPWLKRCPPNGCRYLQKWFKKNLLRRERQVTDYFHHLAQLIGNDGNPVVSDMVLISKWEQKRLAEVFARCAVFRAVVNGQVLSVDFSDAASSAHRRASKLYVRAIGLEKYYASIGLRGYFVTLTLPPECHPNPSNGNSSWSGVTPLHGHEILQRKWRLLRGAMSREIGRVIGLRVEEPHRDGTPHWHILMAMNPSDEATFRALIQRHFGDQIAADVTAIDPKRGSGASYMMKYLIKA